jgi:ABC-2 type transport system ATP-binding protein
MLSEIEMTCDRIAIIHEGELVLQGRMGDLLTAASAVTMEVRGMNDAAMAAVRAVAAKLRLDCVPVTRFTAWVTSESDIPALARAIVTNGADLVGMTPHRETLEELYVRTIEAQM